MSPLEMQLRLEGAAGEGLTREIRSQIGPVADALLRKARSNFRAVFTSRTGRFIGSMKVRMIKSRVDGFGSKPAIAIRAAAPQANILEYGGKTHPKGKLRKGGFFMWKAQNEEQPEVDVRILHAVTKIVMGDR